MARTAAAGQAVTIDVRSSPRSFARSACPVQLTPTDVQYVTNLQWVDTPDRLFQDLLEETVRRTTNRVVLDPNQTGLDPGWCFTASSSASAMTPQTGQVSGRLRRRALDRRRHPGPDPPLRRHRAGRRHGGRASARRSTAPQTRSRSEVAQWIGG